MLRIRDIKLTLDEVVNSSGQPVETDNLEKQICRLLRLTSRDIEKIIIYKKSLDARKKQLAFIYTVDVILQHQQEEKLLKKLKSTKITKAPPYHYAAPQPAQKQNKSRPIIIGCGPAGLLAGVILAEAGLAPIILERGCPVSQRKQDIETFWQTGRLNPDSNVQFGQGGAGAFSDGKLTTGTKDPRNRKVCQEFVAAGAPEEILYLAKPHIGTDILLTVVENLSKKIIRLGGEIHFQTKMEQLIIEHNQVIGVIASSPQGPKTWQTNQVILAIGHSARDTFTALYEQQVPMEQKPFAIGARIEHPQEYINDLQYGTYAGHPALGSADYKIFTHLPNGKTVYSFCMCPGGFVVAAASEAGGIVTNGMSYHARDGINANSALLISITPEDFPSSHPLAGIELQRTIEQKAYQMTKDTYLAPAQVLKDFLQDRPSTAFGNVLPTYKPGVVLTNLANLFPVEITKSLQAGILALDKVMPGFAYEEALLTAPETRSSSPIRIPRDESCQCSIKGLYPCGEGPGYAGGIISAAVDGIRCAEQIIKNIDF
ncbi:MAG: hypothetical protein HFI72_04115 [Peptococcaceae bacterium]|jgi:uncharacterized FAD-dependent dehydrogenase|nr:hypothetical protein [Peptococcaceae bacterium]